MRRRQVAECVRSQPFSAASIGHPSPVARNAWATSADHRIVVVILNGLRASARQFGLQAGGQCREWPHRGEVSSAELAHFALCVSQGFAACHVLPFWRWPCENGGPNGLAVAYFPSIAASV